ncbi:MAG: GNAT family N-acetyltransferase [Candidatus Yonathbacteria bacterium]|nr:GNAT family N-acetyltransferase [Candidatus Yonathbacteria bacterium]
METNERTHIIAEVVRPITLLDKKILDQIISIEKEAFGSRAFTEQEITDDLFDEENIFVILRKDDEQIIGFTYAKPSDEEHSQIPLNTKTAFIWDTAIQKEFQRKGLIQVLMSCLEEELRRRGYTHLEREATTNNNYAEHIATHYKDKIEIQSEPHDSSYGKQIFFRIRL